MKEFSGLQRGDVAIKVQTMPGRKGEYLTVTRNGETRACARFINPFSADAFLQAFREIAIGEGKA